MRGMVTAKVLAAATLAVMVTGSAFAQRGGGRFGMMGMGGASLLGRPEVQTELKLSDEQKTKVGSLMEQMREERRNRFQDLRDATPEERARTQEQWRTEEMKKVNALLNADQQKRFRQISLQQEGPMAVIHADVASELGLTDDQKKKVAALQREMGEKQRALFQEFQGDREGAMSKMQALRKETNDKVMAVMTDEQKNRWKEMVGAPFTLNALGT
jgi:Spy/CpxP family protein refolding chaperone